MIKACDFLRGDDASPLKQRISQDMLQLEDDMAGEMRQQKQQSLYEQYTAMFIQQSDAILNICELLLVR
jgi:hypothetical protein